MNKTSVVIINYNNSEFLEKCLDSVIVNKPFEIIFVDDHSTDNSVEIASKYDIKIIQNLKNKGPVKSRNIGALESKANYILFLDSDTQIDPDYIEKLSTFLNNNKKIGVVTGKVIESSTNERMWYNFGWEPNKIRDLIGHNFSEFLVKNKFNNLLKFLAYPFTLNFVLDKKTEVYWVVEMAFMIKKEIFDEIGGFDENFYMFFEGPDLCKRIRNKKFKIYYYPYTRVTHLGGHSHSSEKRKELFNKSKEYYFKKHRK